MSEATQTPTEADREPIRVERLPGAQRLLILVYLVVAIAYLSWRPSSFNPDATIFSALVYGAEVFGFVSALLYLYMCRGTTRRTPPPVPAGMTADVFVPTINESVDILRRTLLAATHMQHVGEVWLLDDGNRPEMRALSQELGCRYVARADNTHAKAGNINNALEQCSAEYIALFDADHAPARHFLTKTLGFFIDATVALVQTPHDFYNLDSFQNRVDSDRARVWSEQLLFFRVIQAGKDRVNSAFFCGSCAVIRREALQSIGGIATGTVTEDIQTSLRLHKHRWRSVYHDESLAYGLAPSTATAFLAQRLRWGQGAMQTWKREGLLTAKALTWPQRLCYLATMLAYFEGWQRLILFLSPVVVLAAGIMPIATVDAEFLLRFIPYFVLNYWVFEEVGRGYGRAVLTEQYTMTRFAIFIAATFGYFLRNLRFVVTPKTMGDSAAPTRILWPQMLVLVLNVIAIPIGIMLYRESGHLPQGALVANVIWAAMTAWLAAGAIRHASRVARYRRREYRFPVPIPFRVDDSVALITDVSPAGCRLTGDLVAKLAVGDVVHGSLILPTGEVPVHAAVRVQLNSEQSPDQPLVGCEFLWDSADDQAELELFLYGSDLQWQFNGLSERAPTPLERLATLLGRKPPGEALNIRGWAPVLYTNQDGSGVAYLSPPNDAGERQMVSLDAFAQGTRVAAQEVTATGTRSVAGQLSPLVAPLPLSSMHIYRWTT